MTTEPMRKNSIKWLMAAVSALIISVSMASCGGDDPDPSPEKPGTDKATAVNMQAGVYVSEGLLKYCDVVVTDNSNKQVTLTTSNTTATDTPSFGDISTANSTKMMLWVKNCNDKIRLYKADSETLKSFPVSRTYTITATPKTDVVPEASEKVALMIVPTVDYVNNSKNNTWDKGDISISLVEATISGGDKWTSWFEKKKQITRTFNVSFKSAMKVEYSMK